MLRWRATAAALVLAVAVACSSGSSAIADPRHPGNVAELRKRVESVGPILVKGRKPYWLVLDGDRLVAFYPYIVGYDCLLRPVRPNDGRFLSFRDGRRCTNGGYYVRDMSMYPLRVASDGSVTVDLSKIVPVEQEG